MRMMAAFEKGEKLRFIGHLDLMRTMQRASECSGWTGDIIAVAS